MVVVYFFYGLGFFSLGLAAGLQMRHDDDLPLRKQIPWLAAFGFVYAAIAWLDMFQTYGADPSINQIINGIRMILQPTSGLLLIFGWGVLTKTTPLPTWTHLLPGLLIVPIAFVITYAATTFITPSPIEIPIDIWSRYLLYLPGSIMAGIGFLRQWREQNGRGYHDVGGLMLATGLAFLFEAFVVELVVPAVPYRPASYYNYNRTVYDTFTSEEVVSDKPFGLTNWLDYDRVLEVTGLPIQFWRMLSAIAVTTFDVRGLDVFDAIRKRQCPANGAAMWATFDLQTAFQFSFALAPKCLVRMSTKPSLCSIARAIRATNGTGSTGIWNSTWTRLKPCPNWTSRSAFPPARWKCGRMNGLYAN